MVAQDFPKLFALRLTATPSIQRRQLQGGTPVEPNQGGTFRAHGLLACSPTLRMANHSETIANVALTAMCLVVTFVVAERYLLPSFFNKGVASGYNVGDMLSAAANELPLSRVPLSAVVIVSSDCRFCLESVDFYRKLSALRRKKPGSFQTIFLGMADPDDAGAFVDAYQLSSDHVGALPADVRARIPGTPALFLVSDQGRVTGSWVGKLTPTDERIVLESVSRAFGDR